MHDDSYRSKVFDFMEAAHQPRPPTPEVPPDQRVRLRSRLNVEEMFELLAAVFPHNLPHLAALERDVMKIVDKAPIDVDLPELADACVDTIYLTEGFLIECGIVSWHLFDAIHAANMAKIGPGSWKREDGKIMKPEGWKPADVAALIRAQGISERTCLLPAERMIVASLLADEAPASGREEDPIPDQIEGLSSLHGMGRPHAPSVGERCPTGRASGSGWDLVVSLDDGRRGIWRRTLEDGMVELCGGRNGDDVLAFCAGEDSAKEIVDLLLVAVHGATIGCTIGMGSEGELEFCPNLHACVEANDAAKLAAREELAALGRGAAISLIIIAELRAREALHGEQIGRLTEELRAKTAAAESVCRDLLAAREEIARLMNLPAEEPPIGWVVLSDDGQRVMAANRDETAAREGRPSWISIMNASFGEASPERVALYLREENARAVSSWREIGGRPAPVHRVDGLPAICLSGPSGRAASEVPTDHSFGVRHVYDPNNNGLCSICGDARASSIHD